MTEKYSIITGLEKTSLRLLIVAGPLLLTLLPAEWMNLTLGGGVLFLINWAKNRNLNEEVQAQ
jgi:hypothetical protein